MAAQDRPGERTPSLLERAGVSRGWRLVAAVLIVVLAPVWLPLLFLAFALAAKAFSLFQDLAKLEESWSRRARLPGKPPDPANDAPDPDREAGAP